MYLVLIVILYSFVLFYFKTFDHLVFSLFVQPLDFEETEDQSQYANIPMYIKCIIN